MRSWLNASLLASPIGCDACQPGCSCCSLRGNSTSSSKSIHSFKKKNSQILMEIILNCGFMVLKSFWLFSKLPCPCVCVCHLFKHVSAHVSRLRVNTWRDVFDPPVPAAVFTAGLHTEAFLVAEWRQQSHRAPRRAGCCRCCACLCCCCCCRRAPLLPSLLPVHRPRTTLLSSSSS